MTDPILQSPATRLITDFGKTIGIDGLAFDAFGCCMLAFDDDIIVNIAHEKANQRILLFAYVGRVDAATKPYQTLLKANFYWKATGGATLSLDQNDGAICLTKPFSLTDLDAHILIAELEKFISNIEKWRDWSNESQDFQESMPEEREPIGSFV
ncbi:type III secretion system chaperone [Thalassospira sp. MA62]|nr:type III secretion system chaperone [Thalassospira sp. MA62]